MANPDLNGHDEHATNGATAGEHTETHDHVEGQATEGRANETMTMAATIGVVAVGAALWEVALLPGIALGAAAVLAPKYVPKMGAAITPMFRSSVRGVYKFGQKTREMMAEAKEQVNDIVAEVHAEAETPKAAKAADAPHA
jgi:hypothetical protein